MGRPMLFLNYIVANNLQLVNNIKCFQKYKATCAAGFSNNLSITQSKIVHLKQLAYYIVHCAEVPLGNCSSDSNFLFRSLLFTAKISKYLVFRTNTC